MSSSIRLKPSTNQRRYNSPRAGTSYCDASHGCFLLLPTPLSRVVEECNVNQFVGIEFNPTARTNHHSFRMILRHSQAFALGTDGIPSRFDLLRSRAPTRPTAAFSLISKYSYQHTWFTYRSVGSRISLTPLLKCYHRSSDGNVLRSLTRTPLQRYKHLMLSHLGTSPAFR